MRRLEEPGGEDYILRFRFGDEHPLVFGVAGVVLALAFAVDLRIRWWPVFGAALLLPVVLALSAGAVCGGAVRLVTAASGGANIGGGMAMMVGPFVVAGLLAHAVHRGHRLRGSSDE